MRLVDIYFRSLFNSRKNILENREGKNDLTAIINANSEVDRLESISYKCNIEEDWLVNIEKGIEFIDKAIKEERQFITTQGEVVRIEKAKKPTTDTVKHLAKHSDLITHLPESKGDTIVPDKLYIVEKLSDYAVYENRFIYMLLCYLRDFINLRLDKIEDKLTTYTANLYFKKDISINFRNTKVESKVEDVIKHDPFLTKKYKEMPLISRINDVYDTVLALLNTPLMMEVSKAPMIKPPIVATNVLKMNPNFKGALALYNFISSYPRDGYTFEEVKKVYNPFEKDMAEDYATVISLLNFTTYKYGNNIKLELNNQFQKDNKELEDKEIEKYNDQIAKLKRRVKEQNNGWEEYTINLEQKGRALEAKIFEIKKLEEKVDFLVEKIETLEKEKADLTLKITEADKTIEEKINEILRLNQKYVNDLRELNDTKEEEKTEMSESFIKEKEGIVNDYNDKILALHEELNKASEDKEILIVNQKVALQNVYDQIRILEVRKNELMKEHEAKIQDMISKHELELQDAYDKKDALVNEYEEKIQEINNDNLEKIQKINSDYEIKLSDALSDKTQLSNEYEEKIQEIDRLRQDQVNYRISVKEEIANEFEGKIQEMSAKHAEELNNVSVEKDEFMDKYVQKIDELNNKHHEDLEANYQEKDKIANDYALKISDINQKYEDDLKEINEKNNEIIINYNDKIKKITDEHNLKVSKYEQELKNVRIECQEQLLEKEEQYDYLESKKNVILASLNALRHRNGLKSIEEELTLRDKFKVLEEQEKAFKKYYDFEWKQAKKQIKQEIYNQVLDEEENLALKKEEAKTTPKKKTKPRTDEMMKNDSIIEQIQKELDEDKKEEK